MKVLWLTVAAVTLAAVGCTGKSGPIVTSGRPVGDWVADLSNPDPKVPKKAVQSLGHVGTADPAALPAMIGGLKDKDAGVREAAILAVLVNGSSARMRYRRSPRFTTRTPWRSCGAKPQRRLSESRVDGGRKIVVKSHIHFCTSALRQSSSYSDNSPRFTLHQSTMNRLSLAILLCALASSITLAQSKPLPPLEAAKKMTVPDGFKVTLFAGEPDVVQPIAFTFDDRGRMWVVECLSLPATGSDGKGTIASSSSKTPTATALRQKTVFTTTA